MRKPMRITKADHEMLAQQIVKLFRLKTKALKEAVESNGVSTEAHNQANAQLHKVLAQVSELIKSGAIKDGAIKDTEDTGTVSDPLPLEARAVRSVFNFAWADTDTMRKSDIESYGFNRKWLATARQESQRIRRETGVLVGKSVQRKTA